MREKHLLIILEKMIFFSLKISIMFILQLSDILKRMTRKKEKQVFQGFFCKLSSTINNFNY